MTERRTRTSCACFPRGFRRTPAKTKSSRFGRSGGESDSASRQLARYIDSVSKEYLPANSFRPLLVFRRDRYLRGGDQISFNEQGFAAVRFTEYRENYNHQHQNVRTENGVEYGDLPKFVDYDYVANVARLNAATLASLASAPAPPGEGALVDESPAERFHSSMGELRPAVWPRAIWFCGAIPAHLTGSTRRPFGNVTQATLPHVEGQRDLCGAGHRRQRPPEPSRGAGPER